MGELYFWRSGECGVPPLNTVTPRSTLCDWSFHHCNHITSVRYFIAYYQFSLSYNWSLWRFFFLFCFFVAIRRNSLSLLRFPFRSRVQVFTCETSPVCRLKYSYRCFFLPFLFPSFYSFVCPYVVSVVTGSYNNDNNNNNNNYYYYYYYYYYFFKILYFEQILETTPHKTTEVRPLISHRKIHPSKTNKICDTLLEKQKRTYKRRFFMAPYTWPCKYWPTSKNLFLSVLCR